MTSGAGLVRAPGAVSRRSADGVSRRSADAAVRRGPGAGLRRAALILVGLLLVAACGQADGPDDLATWLRDECRKGVGFYECDADPTTVAGRMSRKFDVEAQDRIDTGGKTYLRFSESMVAVHPQAGGSRVYLDPYEVGYERWHSDVSPYWGPDNRGGGPGEGK